MFSIKDFMFCVVVVVVVVSMTAVLASCSFWSFLCVCVENGKRWAKFCELRLFVFVPPPREVLGLFQF
jgi:hypothetical protein